MKVKTITIHYGVNYGSALQTYALCKVLQKMGHEVEVINYVPLKYNLWNEFSADKIGKYPALIILGAFAIKAPEKIIRRRKFSSFLKEYVPLTKKYTSTKELKDIFSNEDLFIVGSDQVWNFDYNGNEDYTYFLDFVKDKNRCISYAASIGKMDLSVTEEDLMKHFLCDFKSISVREDYCVEQMNKIGLVAKHVLDPTLLLSSEDWNELIDCDDEFDEKYILVYVMDFLHQDLLRIAEQIKRLFGFKIYLVSFSKINDDIIDRQFIFATPKMFLSLVKNASYVVTNSFHGVAFSVNYNKQFIAVGKSKYNVRIQSLLRQFNLNDRFVLPNEHVDEKIINEMINYEIVDEKIKLCREESKEFLKMNLS